MNENEIRPMPEPLLHSRLSLYADSGERERHRVSMRSIAEELDRPEQEIAERYERTLAELKARASVPDYLPILVSKKVRETYR